MAHQGDRPFTQLPPDARDEIALAMIAFVESAEESVNAIFETQPSPSSPAADYLAADQSTVRSQGEEPVKSAIRSMAFATVAGLDHARGFAYGLETGRLSFSLATTTRGAVEALARAWWLVRSDSAETLLARWLSLQAKELSVAITVNPDVRLSEMRGSGTLAGDHLVAIQDDLERLTGNRRPIVHGYTGLATELLTTMNKRGRVLYSHLSSVAHGESLGVNGFFGVDDEQQFFVTALPERSAVGYSEQVFACSGRVLRGLLEFVGIDPTLQLSTVAAHDRLRDTLIAQHSRVFGAAPGTAPW